MAETKMEKGARWMSEVCGVSAPAGVNRFADMTMEHLFADVWSDETLSVRDRRLIVLGILGARGDAINLEGHMGQALTRGDLSEDELDEVVVQIAHYAGWPCGSLASQVAGKLKAARQA